MNSSANTLPHYSDTNNTQGIKSATTPPAADWPEMLTVNPLGQILGVSWQPLLRWRKASKGPRCFRLGPRSIRYHRADVEAWLTEHSSW